MQHLQSTAHLQQHLLVNTNSNDQQRRERLMATIDRINQRYGNGTVRWAACGMQSSWSMRRERLSQATTTRLNHVPIVWA
jgi:DNA polymerase V